jgi:exopolysaccharide production protein ExoF
MTTIPSIPDGKRGSSVGKIAQRPTGRKQAMTTIPSILTSRASCWLTLALLFPIALAHDPGTIAGRHLHATAGAAGQDTESVGRREAATFSAASLSAAGPLESESAVGESGTEILGRDLNTATFAVGDRLKINLFENLHPGAANERVLANLVERPEITGEYVVQQDGKVFLPLVGGVGVAGRTHAEFEQAVESDFKRAIGSPVKVIIQMLEREPIYVTGPVARPGTFKYVPGMSVLHALALAGGVEGVSTDQWKRLDLSRERERVEKSQERLRRLLALRDVLLAEREGKAAAPSKQVIELAGQVGALRLVADEERLRALEFRRRSAEEEAFVTLIRATHHELSLLRERMTHSEAALREKTEYVKTLSGLRARGAVTDVNFYLAQSELNNAQERWHEVRALIAQLERKLVELEQQKVRTDVQEQIKREREIRVTQQAIAEEEVTQAALGRLFSGLADTYPAGVEDRTTLRFRIIRRTTAGLKQLASDALSLLEALEPGDILQVSTASAQGQWTQGQRTE